MVRYPPLVSALASDERERAASNCTERGKDYGKCGSRGTGIRGSVPRAGNIAQGRVSHLRDAGSGRTG